MQRGQETKAQRSVSGMRLLPALASFAPWLLCVKVFALKYLLANVAFCEGSAANVRFIV
jgi:hypothetical protein